jgi:hypothetical protein
MSSILARLFKTKVASEGREQRESLKKTSIQDTDLQIRKMFSKSFVNSNEEETWQKLEESFKDKKFSE